MGRPPKLTETDEILKQIEGLGRIQCTMKEAAAVLRVHRDTFGDFIRSHQKAKDAWENGLESGRASLRRLQFKSAEAGNATMQIWLGKQWLDQKDRVENDLTFNATDDHIESRIAKLLGKAGVVISSGAEGEEAGAPQALQPVPGDGATS